MSNLPSNPGRRHFVKITSSSAAASLGSSRAASAPEEPDVLAENGIKVKLMVNRIVRSTEVGPDETLLETLRDRLDLTGTKRGCEIGACGACTVLLDGQRVNSCLLLTARCERRQISTIEGLAKIGSLHPLQRAFCEHDALQCGFCTPGQIMSGVGYLAEGYPSASRPETIRSLMSGNICRCGAYPNIVAAISEVAERGV